MTGPAFHPQAPLEGFLAEGGLEDELDRAVSPARHERHIPTAVIELLLFVLVAVIGSVSLSRVVTRGLSDLATRAAVPLDDASVDEALPVEGEDEVALLRRPSPTSASARDLINLPTEQDAERRRWIALVSHDLRTPLTALTTCLQTALADLDQVPDGAARARRRRMQLALTDAQRLRALADDLLDFARLDTEKALVLEPVPPGMSWPVRQRPSRRVLADQTGHALEVEIARGLATLEADGGRLLQALENLIRNGLEHAGSRVRLPRVHAEGTEENPEIVFEVTDDGPGLDVGPDGEINQDALAQRNHGRLRGPGPRRGPAVAAAGGRLEADNGGLAGGARLALRLPLSTRAGRAPIGPEQPAVEQVVALGRPSHVAEGGHQAQDLVHRDAQDLLRAGPPRARPGPWA